MPRNIKDAKLEVQKAFPAAGSNNTSDPIDLEQAVGGELENIVFELEIPATTALVATKNAVFTVQHGDAADSLAATVPAITHTVTGKEGNGSDAAKVRFRLPPGAKRFIAVKCALDASAGTLTSLKYALRVLA